MKAFLLLWCQGLFESLAFAMVYQFVKGVYQRKQVDAVCRPWGIYIEQACEEKKEMQKGIRGNQH